MYGLLLGGFQAHESRLGLPKPRSASDLWSAHSSAKPSLQTQFICFQMGPTHSPVLSQMGSIPSAKIGFQSPQSSPPRASRRSARRPSASSSWTAWRIRTRCCSSTAAWEAPGPPRGARSGRAVVGYGEGLYTIFAAMTKRTLEQTTSLLETVRLSPFDPFRSIFLQWCLFYHGRGDYSRCRLQNAFSTSPGGIPMQKRKGSAGRLPKGVRPELGCGQGVRPRTPPEEGGRRTRHTRSPHREIWNSGRFDPGKFLPRAHFHPGIRRFRNLFGSGLLVVQILDMRIGARSRTGGFEWAT